MRKIICSTLGEMKSREYECQHDWPEDVYVQCGGKGVVIGNAKRPGYVTAFFEAFPFKMFIRGEGTTVKDAEQKAWEKYQVVLNCPSHNFIPEKNRPRNAVCSSCLFVEPNYYAPQHICNDCGKKHVNLSIDDDYYCASHFQERVSTIDTDITPEKISSFKQAVFNEIKDKEAKGVEKNLLDMMAGSKSCASPEDIEDDDYRVEMMIANIKSNAHMAKLLHIAERVNLITHFEHEYQLVDWIRETNDNMVMKTVKATSLILENIFSQLKESGTIPADFSTYLFKIEHENECADIESIIGINYFIEDVQARFAIAPDLDKAYRTCGGVDRHFSWEQAHNKALILVYKNALAS